jgi:malonate transporter
VEGVLKGFFTVGAVLLAGYLLGRFRVLGPEATRVLSALSFSIGLPSLMFSMIVTRHITDIMTTTGLISMGTAVGVMIIFAGAGAVCRWGVRRTTMGALAAGLVNSSNLGVPLSAYILGSATYVTPIILFQLALVTPVALTILDFATPGQRKSVSRALSIPLRNPVTLAALLAILISGCGITIPPTLLAPVSLVAQMTVPLMLLIFGMSLQGFSARDGASDRPLTALSVVLKSFVHPALAWMLAACVFGLDSFSTFVVVACAILPTGQNVVLYAFRYSVGQTLARGTAIFTSALAVPLLLAAALLLR